MSSRNKDPLENQDSPSESSESPSNSDVAKAEENLGHLKIEESLKKAAVDDSEESKPADTQTQEGTLKNEYDPSNEPVAGPSGLQKPVPGSSDDSSNAEPKIPSLPDLQKETDLEEKDTGKDVAEKSVEESLSSEKKAEAKDGDEEIMEDSDTTSSTPPFIQSSTGVTPTSMLQEISPVPGPSRPEENYEIMDCRAVAARFMYRGDYKSASSRRYDYASDSANTSSDISEIRSELADISVGGSVYVDASEDFEKEQSPSFVTAVERQSSEASDMSISELQEDYVPHPTPESSIVSASTPSDEQGHDAYLRQLQREADARGPPISTSSGIGSTDQSELGHLQAWGLAGEMGDHNRNYPNRDVPDIVEQRGEYNPRLEMVEEESISGDGRMQASEALLQERQNPLHMEEPSSSDDAMGRCLPRRVKKQVEAGSVEVGSPSKRRRQLRPSTIMKSKMVKSKSSPAKLSSSDSPVPKSSSSDEVHRKESPDIKTLSEESSKSGLGKKPWQKSGELRRRQHAATSSKDSVIPEEEESSSDTREQKPGLKVAKNFSPEKMDIEKSSEVVAESTEASGSIHSVVSSDQAYGSEVKETEDRSLEVSEFERSVGKSKRNPKLSNSPPSDEKQDSSAAKAPGRPKKKPRSENLPAKTRRTRHDSGDTVPKSVHVGSLPKSESTSSPEVSDYNPSDEDEEETAL